MTELSSRIRQARQSSRLTQAELAGRIGVKRSAVTQWEQIGGTTPSIRHLIDVAEYTGVHLEWLAVGRGPQRSTIGRDEQSDELACLDEEERALLTCFRGLSTAKRRSVLDMLEALGKGGVGGLQPSGHSFTPKL